MKVGTYGDAILGGLQEGAINDVFEVDGFRTPLNSIASDDNFGFAVDDSLSKRFCRKSCKNNLEKKKKKN